jgi:uncharacterized protein
MLGLGEHHPFEAAGRRFVYLVPSAAIFALDELTGTIVDALGAGPLVREALVAALAPRFGAAQVATAIDELLRVQLIRPVTPEPPARRLLPLVPFPLTTMVLNVTTQCNLSCTYCYEYGEDRIVDQDNGKRPRFMSMETARASVDRLLAASGSNRVVRLTFFGGETLLNFRVVQATILYARQRAAEVGKQVEFSVTTNATLLKPDVIEFLAANDVAVTVSLDGPRDVQDRFRVFKDGAGSYDRVLPLVKALLARHRRRPIGARVTVTAATLDIVRTFRHLTEEVGFHEVGFAPVTTAPGRSYAIAAEGFDRLLEAFGTLAEEFLACALTNRHHGFSNVKDTLEEIHKGMAKAYPCGAGLGLVGVATDGEINLCHRFAGSPAHRLGHVADGIDPEIQRAWLERHHVDHKSACRTCWARPLCAGGCYHEAQTRYGDTAQPNLHYCQWVRQWTDLCLRIYGELAVRNPAYLARFDGDS